MTLDAGRVLRDAADDLVSPRGAVLYVALAVVSLVSLPIYQTLSNELGEWMVSLEVSQQLASQLEMTPEELFLPAAPLALDVGLPILVVGLAATFLLSEGVRLVAIRAFASASDRVLPTAAVTRNFLPTFAVLVVASLLVNVAVYGGMVLLILPGLVAAVLVVFVRQAVALDGDGPIAALRRSASLVLDHPVSVLLLLVALVVLGFLLGLPAAVVPPTEPVQPILSAVIGAVPSVYGIAVFTRAYGQLGAVDVDEGLAEREDSPGALGADDIDEDTFADERANDATE